MEEEAEAGPDEAVHMHRARGVHGGPARRAQRGSCTRRDGKRVRQAAPYSACGAVAMAQGQGRPHPTVPPRQRTCQQEDVGQAEEEPDEQHVGDERGQEEGEVAQLAEGAGGLENGRHAAAPVQRSGAIEDACVHLQGSAGAGIAAVSLLLGKRSGRECEAGGRRAAAGRRRPRSWQRAPSAVVTH